MNNTNPITGDGVLWAMREISKRFEQAAAKPREVPSVEPEGPKSDTASFIQESENTEAS